jgi:uncharacterized membrane protein (UPF0127 family)
VIVNKSTKKTIAKDYKVCRSFLSQALGLMFSRKKNLLFMFNKEKRISLHMLFVFFPIWAVYLNKNKQAVFIKKLSPFISAFYPKQKAKYVLELPAKPAVKIGDKLSW